MALLIYNVTYSLNLLSLIPKMLVNIASRWAADCFKNILFARSCSSRNKSFINSDESYQCMDFRIIIQITDWNEAMAWNSDQIDDGVRNIGENELYLHNRSAGGKLLILRTMKKSCSIIQGCQSFGSLVQYPHCVDLPYFIFSSLLTKVKKRMRKWPLKCMLLPLNLKKYRIGWKPRRI